MKFKVIVSHPGKQYVHQLLFALQQSRNLVLFFTTVWYKKDSFSVNAALRLSPFTRSTFRKRYFEPLDDFRIKTNLFPEFLRLMLSRLFPKYRDQWVFMVERMHDNYVARQLRRAQYDILLAYENASYKSFEVAKKQGKITVLDLAQVHHTLIEKLRMRYPDFKSVVENDQQFQKVNVLKHKQNLLVDFFFVLSDFAKESLIVAGIPEARIYKVNLGFDPSIFSQKKSYKREKFTVLFAGTVTKRKGVHLVIEAFKQLALKNSELKIVGPMSDAENYLNNLPGNIFYTPFLHHQQLVKHYQEADVFVFPSFLDSWGMVVLEAMACGTPVIVSENTGAKDVVNQGGGFVIPVDDIASIKEKVLYLYQNRDQLEIMGRDAHRVSQQYTWAKYHRQVQIAVDDIYKKGKPCVELPE